MNMLSRYAPLLLVLGLVMGCHRVVRRPLPQTLVTLDGVAGIEAHTESAERHVQSAKPFSNDAAKLYLQAASEEHREVLTDATLVRTSLQQTQGRLDELADQVAQRDSAYTKLQSRWYVVWGRRIERALWTVGITWLVMGIASVVLGMGNPLGWSVALGKEIVRLVPAMNCFAWVRDWIKRRRGATAPTVIANPN